MRYKNIIAVFLATYLLLLPFVSVGAGEATVHKFAGLEMGYGTFSFDEKLDHKIVFPVANLTAGLAYRRFNFIVNFSGSISDAGVSEEEMTGSASRKDNDVTFGYQLNKVVSVFAGLKEGETRLLLINRLDTVLGGGQESYEQSGVFVGTNLNWSVEGAGKLGITLAYAALQSDNLFLEDGDEVTAGETLEIDDIDGPNNGNSSGYSFSLSWSMPMKGNLIFRSRLKLNRYQQDIDYLHSDNQTYHFNNVAESSTMLFVGVTSIF